MLGAASTRRQNMDTKQKMILCVALLMASAVFVQVWWSRSLGPLPVAVPPSRPSEDRPHIVFVLVDDWGFADVGFRNPAIKTPTFDKLAKAGVILDRHYVAKYCSPSRASLMSGRWPHHAHQWNIVPQTVPLGMNLNFTAMPAKLKQAGYSTHMIGKWHLGLKSEEYLPVNRGFDTMTGYLSGNVDHYTQDIECGRDFWANRGPDKRTGYDSYLCRDDVDRLLADYDKTAPLFLYLALHNVHAPLKVPEEWLGLYPKNRKSDPADASRRGAKAHKTCSRRQLYQAMVSVADDIVGVLVKRLKEKGMWEKTLLVVASDNGGAPCVGSNYPLKGCKGTFFEGGVRGLAFAGGGLIPGRMRGTSLASFVHIADWYPTFCGLAGVDQDDSGPGKFPVDGTDVWPLLRGDRGPETAQRDIVLGFNFSDTHPEQGAIIIGDHKLILGRQETKCNSLMHSPLNYPCTQGPTSADCDPNCLYNIRRDPSEKVDLYHSHPRIAKALLDKYMSYASEPRNLQDQGYHSNEQLPPPADDEACPYFAAHGGYFQPWLESKSKLQSFMSNLFGS